MKVKAVFEAPKNCYHCPCHDAEYDDCQLVDFKIPYFNSSDTFKPAWCPLQEVSE